MHGGQGRVGRPAAWTRVCSLLLQQRLPPRGYVSAAAAPALVGIIPQKLRQCPAGACIPAPHALPCLSTAHKCCPPPGVLPTGRAAAAAAAAVVGAARMGCCIHQQHLAPPAASGRSAGAARRAAADDTGGAAACCKLCTCRLVPCAAPQRPLQAPHNAHQLPTHGFATRANVRVMIAAHAAQPWWLTSSCVLMRMVYQIS